MMNGAVKEQMRRLTVMGMLNRVRGGDDDIFERDNDGKDSFMKKYIRGLKRREMPEFVYDALKWYEKPVHLHVDNGEQRRLMSILYGLLSQSRLRVSGEKAMDYISFKNMCVCGGLEDNCYFYDFMIDYYYGYYTNGGKKAFS